MREGHTQEGELPGGRILVVDDHEPNRLLLEDLLEPQGYQVILAEDGEEAIRLVAESQPDLVLLDVMMPGQNGLEVCRRLRVDPETGSLPIILVTALAEREHRLQGIDAGANDYLTKPIDRAELLLRVRNALHLRKLHAELAAQYQQLKDLEELRDSLVHMIVHDLRSPLTGIVLYLGALIEEIQDPAILADLEALSGNVRHLTDMVSNVLDVSRFEADAMPLSRTAVDLAALVAEAIRSLGVVRRRATVNLCPPPEHLVCSGDRDVLKRVVANLVDNALKFTPTGGEVRVEVKHGAAGPEVRVTDTGPGIPAEYHDKIFEKFGQVRGGTLTGFRSSGLGLTFCKLAVEAHGGRIGVASEIGKGSTFWLALPEPDAVAASEPAASGEVAGGRGAAANRV